MTALLPAIPCRAQTPVAAAATEHFDIYTVKPNKSGTGMMSMRWHDNVFQADNVTLKMLVQMAYDIRSSALVDLPKWGESAHWDIQCKISEYDPEAAKKRSRQETRLMQQEMLASVFHLRAHRETKEGPIYELVVAKGGVKMTENTVKDTDPEAKKKLGNMSMSGTSLDAQGIPIESLAKALQEVVERPVIDKTGLVGKFDMKLRWTPDEAAGAAIADNAEPGIFQAVQDQLGLKLQPAKGPVELLVIDKADLPETD